MDSVPSDDLIDSPQNSMNSPNDAVNEDSVHIAAIAPHDMRPASSHPIVTSTPPPPDPAISRLPSIFNRALSLHASPRANSGLVSYDTGVIESGVQAISKPVLDRLPTRILNYAPVDPSTSAHPSRDESQSMQIDISGGDSFSSNPARQAQRQLALGMSSAREQPATILSGGRMIRVIIYGRYPEDVRKIWVDWRATYGDVASELATMESNGRFVVLQPHWGWKPHWSVSDPDLLIESTCQALYAVFMSKPIRYIVGLVRTRQSDYPIAIFETAKGPPVTISQAVTASDPYLNMVEYITKYHDNQDVSNELIDYDHLEAANPSTFPTVIIITVESPTDDLLSDLSIPVPTFLQIPFTYSKHLMKRAYDLKYFSLRMIHVSRAIRHLVICLVQDIGHVYQNGPSGVETALGAGDDFADLLRVAPLYSRALQVLLDKVNGVMETLESGTIVQGHVQIDRKLVV